MSFSAKKNQSSSIKSIFSKIRAAGSRKPVGNRRRVVFEALEERQMLDAAGFETLPEVITIANPDSYHYAYEGTPLDFVDQSSVDGLTASFVSGDQVAIEIHKTNATSGAVSNLGEIVIQLFNNEAPNSVSHFEQLVFNDYYEGKTFHRIYPGFMFQGGSSDGHGYYGSDLGPIADEHSDVLTHSGRGMVAYANSGPNTSDAQFYVLFDAANWLDGGYNVFGFVVDGYDVIDQMEAAEVVANEKGEVSSPVDLYTIEGVRFVENPTQSALRIVSDENANGVTSISFSSSVSDDALAFQETTVYVGEDGFEAYVQRALAETNFDVVAGSALEFSLPTEFGGNKITYTITADEEVEGFSIVKSPASDGDYTINTEVYAGQFSILNVVASTTGYSKTFSQTLNIVPSQPTVELTSSSSTKVGDLEGGVKLINSDLSESALSFTVNCSSLADEGATTSTPIRVRVDGTEYTATSVSKTYDPGTRVATYNLSLQLRGADKLSNGLHELGVSQYVPTLDGEGYANMYSAEAKVGLYVDTEGLSFAEATKTLDLNVGDAGTIQLHTNKADSEGVERSDITFHLVNPDAGPRFISLTEAGALSWDNIVADDAGQYQVAVAATDALGNVATANITINVGSAPIFAEDYSFEATTGQLLEKTVVATSPASAEATIVYELVGTVPEGMQIDAETGVLTWPAPANYFSGAIAKFRETEISIKATATTVDENGVSVPGESTTKSFPLIVNNANYDEAKGVVPEWEDVADHETEPGATFTVTLKATAEIKGSGSESGSGESGEIDPGSEASQEDLEFEVVYALVGDYPTGMTIGEESGTIAWSVPSDYFGGENVESKELTITAKATTVYAKTDDSVDYSGSSTKSFKLTVNNPAYVDNAPVFGAMKILDADGNEVDATITGRDYTVEISATDPEGVAEIVYELVGTNYPDIFSFDPATGTATLSIPEDHIPSDRSAELFKFTVKATERKKIEDNVYENGKSTEKTFEIMIANAAVDTEELIDPTFETIPAQTVRAGETLTVTAVAKASKQVTTAETDENGELIYKVETVDLAVEYSLGEGAPAGMTIDSETGTITWDVPEDYIADETVKSQTLTVKVGAKTVVDKTDYEVQYGGSAETSFEVTVTNPNYHRTEYDSWRDWFDGWTEAAKTRAEEHQDNLQSYLTAYLEAVKARRDALAEAKADYVSGETTMTEYLVARQEANATYDQTVAAARIALAQADAKTDADYLDKVEDLGTAYESLAAESEREVPSDLMARAESRANRLASKFVERETSDASFRLCSRSTGAKVATDLATVLAVWRDAYSRDTIYDALYADPNFAADAGEETGVDSGSTSTDTTDESGSTETIDDGEVVVVET
ncbi:MAG: peptidylprolyl isomerase [Thermoguttaceae bacterium]|nr:peptidylprolyl isomerase [Thermoguttaceae bacterium]